MFDAIETVRHIPVIALTAGIPLVFVADAVFNRNAGKPAEVDTTDIWDEEDEAA